MSNPSAPAPSDEHDPPWPDHGPEWRHDAGDPEDAFPVPFSVLDALAMVLWTLIAQVLVVTAAAGVGLVEVGRDLAETPATGIGLQIVAQVVTLVGIAGYLGLRGAWSWRLLGPRPPRWRHVGIGMGLGIAGLVIVLTLAEIVNQAFGPYDAPEQFALQVSTSSVLVLVMTAVSAILLAPVVEELVFRSLVFQSVRARLGLSAAMVVQALVFAYIHLEVVANPPAVVGLVALALWLAGAFHRTGSLLVPVTAHATYNATVLLLQVVITVPPPPA